MKKMNTLFTALALIITAVTPMTSLAVSPTEESENQITLSKTYDPYYTIHIPDANPTLDEESVNVEFGVTGYLEYNKKLTVSVNSANNWNLKDTNTDNDTGVAYAMKVGENVITDDNNEVMSVTSEDNKHKVDTQLTFCDFGEAVYAGTYTDTLTFEVKVEDIKADEQTEVTTTTVSSEETEPTEATTTPDNNGEE